MYKFQCDSPNEISALRGVIYKEQISTPVNVVKIIVFGVKKEVLIINNNK